LRRQQGVTSQMINREHHEEEKEGISRNHLMASDPFGFNNDVAMPSNQQQIFHQNCHQKPPKTSHQHDCLP
jgi:hypothetical protein